MQGRIDGMSGEVLRAWAWDPTRPAERLRAQFIIDGVESEVVVADAPRQDLRVAGIGDGVHGIRFTVPGRLFANVARDVALYALADDDQSVELDRRQISFQQRTHLLDGRVETFRRGRCLGWVWSPWDADQRVAVEAVWNGTVVGTAIADKPRKDLFAAGIGDGAHGFEIALPASVWQFPDADASLTVQTSEGHVIGTVRLPANDVLRSLVDLGRQAEREGDHRTAIKNLDEALRLSPDNVDALWVRARIAAGQGDTEKARTLARQAFELHPSHARAVVILGRLAYNEGNYEESLEFWRQVQPGDTAYRESLIKAGRSLQRLKRHVEILPVARQALQLNAEDADALQLIADAHATIGHLPLAVRHLRVIEKLKPNDKKISTQIQKFSGQEQVRQAPIPLEVLENPTLISWEGPAEGVVAAPTEVTKGVFLRPADRRGSLSYRVTEPQEFRAGDLPHYGLAITADRTPAELGFRLNANALGLVSGGIRLYLDARSIGDQVAPVEVALLLRLPGRQDVRRLLLSFEAQSRAQLHAFDLVLGEGEQIFFSTGEGWLMLRLAANRSAVLRAPRPLLKIGSPLFEVAGTEGPVLDALEFIDRSPQGELRT